MQTLPQLIQEFEDAHSGTPWYGLNFHEIVDDITAKEALATPGNGMSIARLLFHMIKWRKALSERLNGTPGFSAADNDPDNWVPLHTLTDETWQAAKKEYDHQQEVIVSELKNGTNHFWKKNGGLEKTTDTSFPASYSTIFSTWAKFHFCAPFYGTPKKLKSRPSVFKIKDFSFLKFLL